MKLSALPRVKLASCLPTPLQELRNFSRVMGGPRIFIKRDDLTGLALGGNKTRKLEYLMADALKAGSDYIVTGAGFQSNWCTQAAAAALKLGMKIVLIKEGPADGYDPIEYDGNHLLHFLEGAEIRVAHRDTFESIQFSVMEDLRAKGHTPFFLANTGSTPAGVAGYVNAMLEILQQSVEIGINIDYLIHATGSGGTQAGLVIAAKALNSGITIIASSTGSRPRKAQQNKVFGLIEESLAFLEVDITVRQDDVIVYDDYAGGGYGFITEAKAKAIRLLAETEAVFLDPVYSGSAMALLIGLCRQGFFKKDDVVVFLHTGGAAMTFAYRQPLRDFLSGRRPTWVIPPWSPEAHLERAE